MAPLCLFRSMHTTLKPTPGRKLPQNLMKKSVSLEFHVSSPVNQRVTKVLEDAVCWQAESLFRNLARYVTYRWLQDPACLEL